MSFTVRYTEVKLPQKPGKVAFSTKRRPADIAAEKILQDKRDAEEEFVRRRNLHLQQRIAVNMFKNRRFFEALEYIERVCQSEVYYADTEAERLAKELKRKERERIEELNRINAERDAKKRQGKKGKRAEQERARLAEIEESKKKEAEREARKKERERKKREKTGEADPDDVIEDPTNKDWNVHMIAGRCCTELFKVTQSHHHLENAYAHYTRSVEAMSVPREGYDMST